MKCPHCLTSFHDSFVTENLLSDDDYNFFIYHQICPECNKKIIKLRKISRINSSISTINIVYPKAISRQPLPDYISPEFSDDYNEACLVLSDSPKASAALSRRCLQNILREKAELKKIDTKTGKFKSEKLKQGNLVSEIKQVLEFGGLPSNIADSLDYVRIIGNYSAHPNKSKSTGEIVKVEQGEAEWNLDVLEMLFDFYFIQPERAKNKKGAFDSKFKEKIK
jgi:uncharacterized protein DUF4145